MKISNLSEKWLTSTTNDYERGKVVDIWMNPTNREYLECVESMSDGYDRKHKNVRCIVDRAGMGNVFLFDGNFLHQSAVVAIGIQHLRGFLVPIILGQDKYIDISTFTLEKLDANKKELRNKSFDEIIDYKENFLEKNLLKNKNLRFTGQTLRINNYD